MRTNSFVHSRAAHLGCVAANLSCESNAFQGISKQNNLLKDIEVLISLARVMLFRDQKASLNLLNLSVLISLARVMLFRVMKFGKWKEVASLS